MERRDLPKIYFKEFGKHLKKLREKKELSLEKMGLECGLTKSEVHRIQRGMNITMTTILRLALALDISPAELLKFDFDFKPGDMNELINSTKSARFPLKKTKTKKKKSVKKRVGKNRDYL
ncbi:MAG: helix-turn-helix domain-containing protein [Bacteroidia bacterium]